MTVASHASRTCAPAARRADTHTISHYNHTAMQELQWTDLGCGRQNCDGCLVGIHALQRIQLVIRKDHPAKHSVPLACKWRGAMTGCCQLYCAPCTCSLHPVGPAHPLCTHRTLRKPTHYTNTQCIHFSMPAGNPWSTTHVTTYNFTIAWRRACQLCSASARQPGLPQREGAANRASHHLS